MYVVRVKNDVVARTQGCTYDNAGPLYGHVKWYLKLINAERKSDARNMAGE